ncbi:TlpA family protein disulfide reductase [Lutibacter sp. A64]|uniref:TlpA family protein disulfide reductase n=1 Tax=Lutibacter sp. A64 TaxID=2918526 RepID=UPI001F067748|nr:TlpA disulfide reductase family protein [Lutibacter sp. A64]UMB53926.1 TlpA family protein disulfide reductase [Lutibacter sp. A64]
MANQFEKPNPVYRYKINRKKFVDDTLGVNWLLNEVISENNKQLLMIDEVFNKNKIDKSLMIFLKNESNKNLFSTLLLNYNFSKLKIFLNNLKSEKFISESSLLNNRYKYEILITYINLVVLKGKVEKSRSKLFIDYVEAYKILPNFLSGNLLKDARKICLHNSFQQGEEVSKIYSIYNDFKLNYKDSIFINFLDEKYLIKLKKIEDSLNINDVFLINGNKQKINLKEIINQNKGKLIYIDFWASWCAPCKEAMPSSQELVNDYKSKEVIFIYVSIDSDFDKWERASKEEDLSIYKYNVLAINYPKANFYKELNLKTIPRYILYDKNGKLVHKNAPGPDGIEIRKLLNEYLNK